MAAIHSFRFRKSRGQPALAASSREEPGGAGASSSSRLRVAHLQLSQAKKPFRKLPGASLIETELNGLSLRPKRSRLNSL